MKIAISACLLGKKCRYDGKDNKNKILLEQFKNAELIAFCPEDSVFGTPRPTMDLVQTHDGCKAISSETGLDISKNIIQYAIDFFDLHAEIDLVIGKDRSPSCGVCSARLYDENEVLISSEETGLMIQEAKKRQLHCMDAENFKG